MKMSTEHSPVIRLLLILVVLVLTGCRETLMHDVDEAKANKVIVLLSQIGIDANKARNSTAWNVTVEKEDEARALKYLEAGGVFLTERTKVDFKPEAFIPSREERSYFLERKTAFALEQTLERLPSVLEARVHLSLKPESSPAFSKSEPITSASALLLVSGETQIEEKMVRTLISGAVNIDNDSIAIAIVSREPTSFINENNTLATTSGESKEKENRLTGLSFVFPNGKGRLLLSALGVLSSLVICLGLYQVTKKVVSSRRDRKREDGLKVAARKKMRVLKSMPSIKPNVSTYPEVLQVITNKSVGKTQNEEGLENGLPIHTNGVKR